MLSFLNDPKDVLSFGLLNVSLLQYSRDPKVWKILLKAWYPRATLENPDCKLPVDRRTPGATSS